MEGLAGYTSSGDASTDSPKNAHKSSIQQVVKDGQLLVMVIALLCVDVLIIVLWEIIDPIYARTINTTSEESTDGDIVYQHQVRVCDSRYKNYFVGAVYVVQGLLMLFGTFLAWETRKVKIAALNDSQYIGMCIYNVFVLCTIGCILSFVLETQIVLHYAMISGFLLFGTTMTQCIIFIPKIINLRDNRVADQENDDVTTGQATKTQTKPSTSASQPPGGDVKKQMESLRLQLKETEARLAQTQDELQKMTEATSPPQQNQQ